MSARSTPFTPKRKPFKSTPPKTNPPVCWECSRKLYGGGRIYRVVEVDDIKRAVHAACLTQMERDAR